MKIRPEAAGVDPAISPPTWRRPTLFLAIITDERPMSLILLLPRRPAGQRGVDEVRRRVQQATHQGHKRDPLYRIRKLLLTAAEQLTSRDEYGCGLGWRPEILVVRWPRPGRAKSCSGPSTERSAWRRPVPPWTASTAGAMASRSPNC